MDDFYAWFVNLLIPDIAPFLIGFLITFFSIKSSNQIIRHLGLAFCGLFLIPIVITVIALVKDHPSDVAPYGILLIAIFGRMFFFALAGCAIARGFRNNPQ